LIVEAFGDYAPNSDCDRFARRFAVDRYATRSRVKADRNRYFAHSHSPGFKGGDNARAPGGRQGLLLIGFVVFDEASRFDEPGD